MVYALLVIVIAFYVYLRVSHWLWRRQMLRQVAESKAYYEREMAALLAEIFPK